MVLTWKVVVERDAAPWRRVGYVGVDPSGRVLAG